MFSVASMHVAMRTRRTGPKLDTERLPCSQDRVANRDSRCLLIHLDSGLIRVYPNNLCKPNFKHCSQISWIDIPPTSSSWPTRTNSYIAAPVMFSAMTTGPETPKTEPKRDSRCSSATLGRSFFAFASAPAMMVNGARRTTTGYCQLRRIQRPTAGAAHVSAPYMEGYGDTGLKVRRRVCD